MFPKWMSIGGTSVILGAIFLWKGFAIALSFPAIAQPADEQLPTLPPPLQQPSPEAPPAQTDPEPVPPASTNRVELNLPELINVTIQGNRDLKDAVLQRIVQRQTLAEVESTFSPRITPSVSIRADRTTSDFGSIADTDDFGDDFSTDRTTLSENIEVSSTLRTSLGTQLELSVAPLEDSSRLNLTVRQPLMRGAGQAVNRAPIQQARIAESNNVLALKQQVINTVTTTISRYTTLVQSQEAIGIQVQALERRRQQFEIISALVEVGRRARIDLIDSERSIAEAELGLQEARNRLAQANTDLLNLIGSDVAYQFVAPDDAIDRLFATAVERVGEFERDRLIKLAYEIRPDYQQALAQTEVEDLNLLLARDNRRWDLSWESTARVGEDSSQSATGLQFRRTFGDESLTTAVERSQVGILQQQNRLAELTETIRNEVSDRLRDVNSELAQVESAQRATEAALLQLQVTQEKFKLGRDGITLFDISQQEENLVAAQNAELQARISVLNSIAELEQAVGITIETWQPVVNFGPVLVQKEND